eukprot:2534310-Amphidinium_carterae.1
MASVAAGNWVYSRRSVGDEPQGSWHRCNCQAGAKVVPTKAIGNDSDKIITSHTHTQLCEPISVTWWRGDTAVLHMYDETNNILGEGKISSPIHNLHHEKPLRVMDQTASQWKQLSFAMCVEDVCAAADM